MITPPASCWSRFKEANPAASAALRLSVRIILRPKYVPVDHPFAPPITAPLHQLQARCIATPRLLANTLILRFEQHLPYYRIEQLYARAGVPLSRQTLCGWAGMAAKASAIILSTTKEEVFADRYVQADEPERSGDSQPFFLHTAGKRPSSIRIRSAKASAAPVTSGSFTTQ